MPEEFRLFLPLPRNAFWVIAVLIYTLRVKRNMCNLGRWARQGLAGIGSGLRITPDKPCFAGYCAWGRQRRVARESSQCTGREVHQIKQKKGLTRQAGQVRMDPGFTRLNPQAAQLERQALFNHAIGVTGGASMGQARYV